MRELVALSGRELAQEAWIDDNPSDQTKVMGFFRLHAGQ